jgi:CHAT domain-containing protein
LIFTPGRGGQQPASGESEIARSIRALREELNAYYHLIEREQLQPGDESSIRVARLRCEIGDRERDLAKALRDVGMRGSRDSEWHAPHVCSVDEVRAALPDGAVLVEFFQAHDRIVVCVVDRQQLEIAPVALAPDVIGHIRLLQFQLSKFKLGAAYVETFRTALLDATRAHLAALFDELLSPVWHLIRGRHLVVVPHGMLHSVPFHALLMGDQYVCDVSTVSYAPSASVFALCERQPASTETGALVLGVPDSRAPFIEREAGDVAQVLVGARLFIGDSATADALRMHGQTARIIHIASHGYFRPDRPMFSGVRLADGYLNVHDLYQLELQADLVALSGCATGATVAAAGDELLGISRGLFLAGARRLLLSAWEVPDGSTAALMTQFYQALADGTAIVPALNETMRAVRRENAHPYYWAPFGVWGKCGA